MLIHDRARAYMSWVTIVLWDK